MDKIDIVIMWVDGSDTEWQKKKKKALNQDDNFSDTVRYRDYGTLKYLFRSIEENCSWVNKVHLVTDNQVPSWINEYHPKLNLVDHKDFIPEEYLPTFNSSVIELNLFRLEALSEKFILFNDDMFFVNKVKESDFFSGNKIVDFGLYNKIGPTEDFAHLLVNNLIIINKYFSKKDSLKKNWKKQFKLRYGKNLLKNFLLLAWNDIPGYENPHLPQPHFKSVFKKVYDLEKNKFDIMFSNKTREINDMNQWIFRYWLLEEGNYVPQKWSFGSYLLVKDLKNIKKVFSKNKQKVVCINDVESSFEDFEMLKKNLNAILKEKYPQKSTYEK